MSAREVLSEEEQAEMATVERNLSLDSLTILRQLGNLALDTQLRYRCVCVCVRACVRACVCVCVWVARARARVSMYIW